jgi:hypothetical protein
MNSKIISLVMFLSIFCISINCQNTKIFNGKYDDGTVNKGFATYSYYEDMNTLEYIKHGAFKFTYSDKDATSSQQVVISGNYKHNKKDGIWSYVITYSDWPTNGKTYNTGTKSLTASYANEKPNGAWVFNYNAKEREKLYSLHGYTWSPFKQLEPESVSAKFNNGVITGSINFINSPPYSDYNSIAGQFDNNGFMSGTWVYKSSDFEKTVEFKNGILVKFLIRENASGKVTSKELDNADMSQIKDKFINGSLSINDLKNQKITIDTIYGVTNNDYDFTMSFGSNDFRFKYIPDGESVDTHNKGKFMLFTQTPTYKLVELEDYKNALDFITDKNNRSAKERLELLMQKYASNLSSSDSAYLSAKVKEVDLNLEQEKKIAKARRDYESIASYIQLNMQEKAYALLDDLLKNSSLAFNATELASMKKQYDRLGNTLQAIESEKKDRVQIKTNQKLIASNQDKIFDLFKVTGDKNSGYSASKKSRLFNTYLDIYNDLLIKMNTNSKSELVYSNLLVTIQNKMITLIDSDSKDIEKLLKKAETIEDKESILK